VSDRWLSYFGEQRADNPGWLATAVQHWGFMEILYGELMKAVPVGGRLLDVGCGMGFTDLFLASAGYQVTGIDNDPRIVERARTFGAAMGINAGFKVGDAFDLSREPDTFDLAFSIGVLEHFDRDVTIQLIREQARCARQVAICIPTKYTAYSDGITDERIYSVRQLRRIVHDAGLQVRRSFGFGDVTATPLHRLVRLVLPRAVFRYAQNRGYGYNMCVIGERRGA
jgi:SAM-dependent methyltransferase